MNRFGVFYCDIYGTYLQNNAHIKDGRIISRVPDEKFNIERTRALARFVTLLDRLCDADSLDELYFSFGSTSSHEEVKACLDEISPYLERHPRVKLGTSFTENEKFIGTTLQPCHTTGKPMQIVRNIHKQIVGELHPNEQFIKYFFADDSRMNHLILKRIVKQIDGEVDGTHFLLGEKNNLNNCICNTNKNIHALINSLETYCAEKVNSVSL